MAGLYSPDLTCTQQGRAVMTVVSCLMAALRVSRWRGAMLMATRCQGTAAGKVTAGLAAARQLLSCAHWEAAYFADLSGCVSPTSAAFAMLSGE